MAGGGGGAIVFSAAVFSTVVKTPRPNILFVESLDKILSESIVIGMGQRCRETNQATQNVRAVKGAEPTVPYYRARYYGGR